MCASHKYTQVKAPPIVRTYFKSYAPLFSFRFEKWYMPDLQGHSLLHRQIRFGETGYSRVSVFPQINLSTLKLSTMVKIVDFKQRINAEGAPFITLELQGDLVMVQSQETGKYYATCKRCSITSTFTEEQVQALIGRELPGRIERVECEEYEYTIPETGESITLSHRYEYLPDGVPTPLRVIHKDMVA